MQRPLVRWLAITVMWLTIVIYLAQILSQLQTLERVTRNIDSTTVSISNGMVRR